MSRLLDISYASMKCSLPGLRLRATVRLPLPAASQKTQRLADGKSVRQYEGFG